jgi:hypothetical protein
MSDLICISIKNEDTYDRMAKKFNKYQKYTYFIDKSNAIYKGDVYIIKTDMIDIAYCGRKDFEKQFIPLFE